MQKREVPSDDQLRAFTDRLRQFRETLPEAQQNLLDALYVAGTGQTPGNEADVTPYWSGAPNPQVGWVQTPWGVAFNGFPQYPTS